MKMHLGQEAFHLDVVFYLSIILAIMCLVFPKINGRFNETACSKVIMVKKVDVCPVDRDEWLQESKEKRCSNADEQCRQMVYHCMTNAFKNATFTFCAKTVRLYGYYCGEYNEKGGIVQANFNNSCKKFTNPCPFFHNSSEEYKYPKCWQIQTIQSKTPGTSTPGSVGYPYLAFLSILVISLIAGVVYQFRNKRNVREKEMPLPTFEEEEKLNVDDNKKYDTSINL